MVLKGIYTTRELRTIDSCPLRNITVIMLEIYSARLTKFRELY